MKQISFLVGKKIIYVDYQISNNKHAYLKVTRGNKLLISAPAFMTKQQLVKAFANRVEGFWNYATKASNNVLYSLADKFIFFNGKKLRLQFLTGYQQEQVKIINKTWYFMTRDRNDRICEALLKVELNKQMHQYVAWRQPFFAKKMHVPAHNIKVSYKFATWATNNLKLQVISYSSRLMHFNKQIIDYVIVHELAHFLVPNHTRRFYDQIAQVLPHHRALAAQLRALPLDHF